MKYVLISRIFSDNVLMLEVDVQDVEALKSKRVSLMKKGDLCS